MLASHLEKGLLNLKKLKVIDRLCSDVGCQTADVNLLRILLQVMHTDKTEYNYFVKLASHFHAVTGTWELATNWEETRVIMCLVSAKVERPI